MERETDSAQVRWLGVAATGADLPTSTDVLIIGGGLAGAALTYYLAEEGVEVTLVERGELNREASGTNAGSMHLQIAIHQLSGRDTSGAEGRLIDEVRMAAEAARMWHDLADELQGPIDLHVTGGLMVAETAPELALLHAKQRLEARAGLETHVLEGEELREAAPYLADDLKGAAFCPLEGHVNPLVVVPLFALRAAERGAQIRTHAEVTAIEPLGRDGGAPFKVTSSAGTIQTQRIVNAAGAWSDEVAALVGLRLPLHRRGLHVNVTEPRERILKPLIQHIGRRLTLKQSANHTFIIGGGWPAQAENAPARYSTLWESAAGNAAVAVRVLPSLADVRVVRTWSGVMPFTDDLSPVVGESTRVPGMFTCVVSSSGFTMSPMIARMLAQQMTDSQGTTVLSPDYLPDRALERGPVSP